MVRWGGHVASAPNGPTPPDRDRELPGEGEGEMGIHGLFGHRVLRFPVALPGPTRLSS